jgi:hypothetical protein
MFNTGSNPQRDFPHGEEDPFSFAIDVQAMAA